MQFGLIGEHLSHSYSAEIHKLIGNYSYEILEIPENKLADFMKKRDFQGINVTIPYKEAVIPFLDKISDTAKKIGAVNTVINENGRLIGHNTDFLGMKSLILHSGIDLKNKKVAILGTGGTSKTAFAVSESLGASEIILVSRSEKPQAVTFEDFYKNNTDTQIIINTTPVGMFPNSDKTPVSLDAFANLGGVIDAIYNPLRTNLVLDAKDRNILSTGGLYMLSAQAVYAASYFMEKEPKEELITSAYSAVKKQKENIVLIGMPSSGKSTVGRLLARELKKDFFDSDAEILERIKMPIRDFFAKFGEAEFRKIEKGVIGELSQKSGAVIATGGGVILDSDNIRALKRNGTLIFLNRALGNLLPTSDRPLSSDFAALEKIFNKRYPIYKCAADIEITADCDIETVTQNILKELV